MPEILTESFCERCGTRYTFESAAPRTAKLKGIKVLSRGLKNFVMSDDTSMDEAMAAARSETDREATAQQLDAFHKTFNFCMSCRQYTCGNCWNQAEGRCLSCAPHLGQEIMPAPFPDLDPAGGLAMAAGGTNGQTQDEVGALAWPSMDLDRGLDEPPVDDLSDLEPIDAAARLAALGATDDDETEAPVAAAAIEDAESDDAGAPVELEAAPVEAEEAPVAADEPPIAATSQTTETVAPAPAPEGPTDIPGRAAVAAGRTSDLFGRFRPGQSLDDALEAFEREQAAAEADHDGRPMESAPAEPVDVAAEPIPAAPEPEPEPEPIAAEPEPEPIAAAPEPEPEPEPIAAASEPEPEPDLAPPPTRDDVVPQPTWRIVAPEPDAAPAAPPPAPTSPGAPATPPAATAEPQWPSQPQWPDRPAGGGLPSLGRPAQPTGGLDALWAESAREVVAPPSAPFALGGGHARPAAGGVQPCVSCGLSLSATARFCRRCGARQG